ncbi:MAG: hypothetical protein RL026_2413 [Pseudomonadota bacterium]|jgi:LEA14-like dessication related protein
MMTSLRVLLLVAAVLLLQACASTGRRFEAPQVQVVGLQVVKADLARQQLRVRLKVHNPNAMALPVRRIDFQLAVAGEAAAEGSGVQPFVVPARGSAEFEVMTSVNVVAVALRLLSGGVRDGKVDYQLRGEVGLDSMLRSRLPFSQSGSVPFR